MHLNHLLVDWPVSMVERRLQPQTSTNTSSPLLMSSFLRFQFKSARAFEVLPFDGNSVKVADLEVLIVQRKKRNSSEGFDLEISEISTEEGMSLRPCSAGCHIQFVSAL